MAREQASAKITAEAIATSYLKMGITAAGVNQYDLALSTDFLLQKKITDRFPFVSANLSWKETAAPLLSPFLLTKRNQLTIALVGLTGKLPQQSKQSDSAVLQLLPWQQVLPPLLKQLQNKSDLIILLSSYPRATNEIIAKQFDTIHIIFQSDAGQANLAPQQVNNTLIAHTAPKGKHLGILKINWSQQGKWGKSCQVQLADDHAAIDRLHWQMGRLQKKRNQDDPVIQQRYQQLKIQLSALEKQRAQRQATAKEAALQQPCSFENHFVKMSTALPQDPTIQSIIDQARRTVNQLNKKRIYTPFQGKGGQGNTDKHYLNRLSGSNQCGECHVEQLKFWQKTAHSAAHTTLMQQQQQFNMDCVSCHITTNHLPPLKPTLLTNTLARLTPPFQGVGCESCHGPGQQHAQNPEEVKPTRHYPTAQVCLSCHTAERDEQFNFKDKVIKIACPPRNAL